MQVIPDWRREYEGVKSIEKDLKGLKFTGPGIYHLDVDKKDTVIIIPVRPKKDANARTIWNVRQPKGTKYEVFYFGGTFSNTIFSVIGEAPVRQREERSYKQWDIKGNSL